MKAHFGICFLLFVCTGKGTAISAVSKIAWINDKYGDDHVIDADIKRRPTVLFAQDDVMSAVPRQEAMLWPGGVIPYELDNFYIRKLMYKRKIELAMRMWESKTCIRFKRRTTESYFLRIYHGHGCKAEVGYFRGMSTVSLGRRCNDLPIILHELGHVIGFWHEQNRPDRDRYVEIIWTNINREYQHAFRKYSSHQINSHTMNYDFYSVMHYGMRSFTKNGGLTIRPRDPTVKQLGGRRLSQLDIKETNLMYKCDKSWKLRQTRFFHSLANDGRWSNWSPWKLCSRHCGGGTQKRLRSCSHMTSRGSKWCSGNAVQSRACNTHRCPDWPHWPSDFKFGMYQFAPKESYCARIYERRQYFQWMNYRLCWSSSGRKLNLRWSDSGAIRSMRCTHITEEREKKSHGWNDNFLCVESNTPYKFTWSSSGPITGLQCLQLRAKAGFDGWNNNFLCAPPYPEKSVAGNKI